MSVAEQIDRETELKEKLIRRIEATHRLGVLQGMLAILDGIAEDDVYVLTPEEEKRLDEAEAEPCISAEESKRRTRECLDNLAKSFA